MTTSKSPSSRMSSWPSTSLAHIRLLFSITVIITMFSCAFSSTETLNTTAFTDDSFSEKDARDMITEFVGQVSDSFKYIVIDKLPEYRDFDPVWLAGKLMQRAAATNTPFPVVHKELAKLINYYQSNYQNYADVDLEYKYNVTQLKSGHITPEDITYQRLSLMFPQLNDLTGPYRPYNNGYRLVCSRLLSTSIVPLIMQHRQFGGLIPQKNSNVLPDYIRRIILEMHLLALSCVSDVDIHKETILLEERIKKSLLSDEQRVEILRNSRVLLEDGQINDVFFGLVHEDMTPA